MNSLIEKARLHVMEKLPVDATGHDWQHCSRVARLALLIADEEANRIECDLDRVHIELAAWLHDLHDWKFSAGTEDVAKTAVTTWLIEQGGSETLAQAIATTISEVSFKGAGVATIPTTLEGKIVQDADRLEAIGAIGIARCFAYGGYKKQVLLDPTIPPQEHQSFADYKSKPSTSINHFFEKLLLLKERMHTLSGRALAQKRHEFMVSYLKELAAETGLEFPI